MSARGPGHALEELDPALTLAHRRKMEILFAVLLVVFLSALDQTIPRRAVDQPGEVAGGDEHVAGEARQRLAVFPRQVREQVEARQGHVALQVVANDRQAALVHRQDAHPHTKGRLLGFTASAQHTIERTVAAAIRETDVHGELAGSAFPIWRLVDPLARTIGVVMVVPVVEIDGGVA